MEKTQIESLYKLHFLVFLTTLLLEFCLWRFQCSLYVCTLIDWCRNVKNIAKVKFPAPDRQPPCALVRFKSIRDTNRALRKIDGKEVKGWCTLVKRQQMKVYVVFLGSCKWINFVLAKSFADNYKYYALWFYFQMHEKIICIHVRFVILQLG